MVGGKGRCGGRERGNMGGGKGILGREGEMWGRGAEMWGEQKGEGSSVDRWMTEGEGTRNKGGRVDRWMK